MKTVNILTIIAVSAALIYLLYRDHINGEWNRGEYLILILTLVFGSVNSYFIMRRRRSNK